MDAVRTVALSEFAYRRIKAYAAFTGISIEVAVSDAISEWMDGTGDLVIEAMQKQQRESVARPRLTIVSTADSLTSGTKSYGNSQDSRTNSSDDRACLQSAGSEKSSAIAVGDQSGWQALNTSSRDWKAL